MIVVNKYKYDVFCLWLRASRFFCSPRATVPKTVILEKYHKFLDVFSKETSDTLSEHSKYDHKIWFLEDYKDHSNSLLQAMSEPKLQFVKKFVEEHLKKRFIKASNAPYLSPILLAVKPDGGV